MGWDNLSIPKHVLEKSIPDRCPRFSGFSKRGLKKYLKAYVPFTEILREDNRLYPKRIMREVESTLKSGERAHARTDDSYIYIIKQKLTTTGEGNLLLVSVYPLDSFRSSLGEHLESKGQSLDLFA